MAKDTSNKELVVDKIVTKEKPEEMVGLEQGPVCKDLEGKFLHIRVGDNSEPASSDAIADVQSDIDELLSRNGINAVAWVTNHLVDIFILEPQIKT